MTAHYLSSSHGGKSDKYQHPQPVSHEAIAAVYAGLPSLVSTNYSSAKLARRGCSQCPESTVIVKHP